MMIKSKLLKALSIEELQERNEFAVAAGPNRCTIFGQEVC